MKMRTLADAESYLDGFLNRERVHAFDYEKVGLERIRASGLFCYGLSA